MHRTIAFNAVPIEVMPNSCKEHLSASMARRPRDSKARPTSSKTRSLHSIQLLIAANKEEEGPLILFLPVDSVRVSCETLVSRCSDSTKPSGAGLLWWRGFRRPNASKIRTRERTSDPISRADAVNLERYGIQGSLACVNDSASPKVN